MYDAEQNVIGSLLIDKDSIGKIYGKISSEMFTSELLGRIFLEFQRGFDNHYDVNPVTLRQAISGDTFPEGIVAQEIKECISTVVSSANIQSYADAVLKNHKAKMLDRILSEVKPSPGKVYEQIGTLITQLEKLADGRENNSATLPEMVSKYKDNYFVENEKPLTDTGIAGLDEIIGGFEGGDMVVIGARPAVGKSAFATQVALNLAAQGKRIGFYNLEMTDKQVYERFVVNQSGLSLMRLRRATSYLGDEKEKFDRANEMLSKRENIVVTTGSKSVKEIRAESLHMGYDIIIIDYMQLLNPDTTYKGNRYAEVGAISRGIKSLAMELKIPIIALSQLNRVSEAKETKEPTMAELREAGNIEQDASVIILLWNKDKDDKALKGCKVEKNRQGKTGKMEMRFDGESMRFVGMKGNSNDGWEEVSPNEEVPWG